MLYCLAILIVTLNKRTSMQSTLHDHKEALCFLSGGFRRSPTNEEKKGQGKGCEKILSLRMQINRQLLVWTKLAPVPE